MENNGFEKIGYLALTRPYNTPYKPRKWAKTIDYTSDFLHKLGKSTTIRFLYYRILDIPNLNIPQTTDTYNSYVTVMTNARKDLSNPNYRILIDQIFDDTRPRNVEIFYDWTKTNEDSLIKSIKTELTEIRRIYPFKKYVEVWFEDSGMYQMYKHIPEKYRMTAECIKGNLIVNSVYGGFRRIYGNAHEEKKKIHIIYVGDFNPAGNRRPYNIKAAFLDLGLPVESTKALVTSPQIDYYNIRPDKTRQMTLDRIKKAKRDPLQKWFIKEYGSDVWDVNAEAMEYHDVEDLITKAIKEQVDVSKLDDLDEEKPVEHKVEWDEDGYYKIKMERLS